MSEMFELMQEHFEEDEMDMLKELTDIYSSSEITLDMFMKFMGLSDRNDAYNTVIINVDESEIIQWDYETETIEMTLGGFIEACLVINTHRSNIVGKFIAACTTLMFKAMSTKNKKCSNL